MKTIVEKIQQALDEQDLEKVYELYRLFFEQLDSKEIEELIELAEYSASIGFYEEAKRAYLSLTELAPTESMWTILLAELLVQEAEYDQALSILYDIPEENEHYVAALMIQAELYQAQGYYDLAERKLLMAKQLAPTEIILDFYLGVLLFEGGAFARSLVFLKRFLQTSHDFLGEERRARELFIEASIEIGDYEPLEELIKTEGLDDVSTDLLERIAFQATQKQEYEHALAIYQQILFREEERLSALLGIAEVYIAIQDYSKALDSLLPLVEMHPYEATVFRLLGIVYEATKQLSKAKEAYRQAYELKWDSIDALEDYVLFLLRNEEYATVEAVVTSLLSKEENGLFFYWLAQAMEGLEKYEEAALYYRQAAKELANSSEFLANYIYFLREEGMISEAKHWLNHGLMTDPLNEEWVRLQQDLEI